MRYSKDSKVTFKTVDCTGNKEVTHYGTVIDIEPNKHFGYIYVIKTNYGNIAKLTEDEVD